MKDFEIVEEVLKESLGDSEFYRIDKAGMKMLSKIVLNSYNKGLKDKQDERSEDVK